MNTDRYELLKKNADTLIENFKQYHLVRIKEAKNAKELKENLQKKRQLLQENAIKKLAMDAVTSELITSQLKNAAIQELNIQIEQLVAREQSTREEERLVEREREQDAINKIKKTAIDAVTTELVTNQIKEAAIQELNIQIEQLVAREQATREGERLEHASNTIKKTAIDAVANELVSNQIKEVAISTVVDGTFSVPDIDNNISANFTDEIIDTETLAKQIILQFIKKHSRLIQTIIAIKKAAIAAVTGAVTPKDITELIKQTAIEKVDTLVLEEQLYDEFEKNKVIIGTLNEEIEDLENNQSPNDEDNKNLSDKRSELIKKTAEQQQLLEKMAGIAAKESVLAKKISIYNSLVQKYKELLSGDTTNQYLTQIQNLNGIVNALKKSILEKELENIAIKTTLSSLPKPPPPVAESKEPLIKNAAINAVKDALITELSKKIAAPVSTAPVIAAPAINIENDLKNAALTALYRALLGVSKEHVDPSKKPTKFDVLITDKTYKYDEKGQPVEEKELTKYDSILAK